MDLAYYSVSGNVKNFVNKLDKKGLEIDFSNPFVSMENEFILIVPTYETNVTECLWDFLDYDDNYKKCKGIIGSGNYNFNDLYIFTAKDLSKDFEIPIIYHFELRGTKKDVDKVREMFDNV